MIDEIVWFVWKDLSFWRLVLSKIKFASAISTSLIIFSALGCMIFPPRYPEWIRLVSLMVLVPCVSLSCRATIINWSLRKHLGLTNIADSLFFLKLQKQGLLEFLKNHGIQSSGDIEILIEHLKRRVDQKNLSIFPMAAVLSFLGAMLFIPYQRFIELGITEYSDAKGVLFSILEVCTILLAIATILRSFFSIRTLIYSTDSERALRALDLMENIHIDMVIEETKKLALNA